MNQLLDSLEYDPERGSLALQSARYVLMPPTLLMEIQKNSRASNAARRLRFSSRREWGRCRSPAGSATSSATRRSKF
jgi:hypothetical protein